MANTIWSATDKSANTTVSGGNLVATTSGALAWVRAVDSQVSGKFYWEAKPTVWGNASTAVGFCPGALAAPNATTGAGMCVVNKNGGVFVNGVQSGSNLLGTRAANDVIGIAVDLVLRLVWFRVTPAGTWNGSATADPVAGNGGIAVGTVAGGGIPAFPLAVMNASPDSITANFGDSAFIGTPPTGFTSGFTAGVTTSTNALVTQTAIEEWTTNVVSAQVTQVAIEQWSPVPPNNVGPMISILFP